MRDTFAAFALKGELDLTKLAGLLGASQKYRWEEPMLLDPETLEIVQRRSGPKLCMLYYFGAAVFINCTRGEIDTFFARMASHSDLFSEAAGSCYSDDYSLEIDPGRDPSISDDMAVMPSCDPVFIDIISFVIAKSVALERIENGLDQVLDEVEDLITLLDRGKFTLKDRKLARLASSILNFRYKSISHIMVLDKPDVTWENPQADRLYLTMAGIFELDRRYEEIRVKSETLMDVTDVFTTLAHARRATKLEWIIIILIAVEIVLYVAELLR